ncbi:MAG TPA: DUF3592 domain-containing protein [Vicinamibacterales bacterium]|nr:DUF3592 domain-containing protein [Vicinamibacterales bacterium]
MQLEVDDKVIADASPADIASALDRQPLPDDWFLTLTNDGEEFMEATARGTRFSIDYREGAERRRTADTVDGATARALLEAYLHGDSSWRTAVGWAPVAERKRSGSGALTAAVTVVAVVAVVAALWWVRAAITLPPPFDDWRAWPVLLVFLAIPGLVVFAAAAKALEVRRASRWTTTNAVITKSAIAVDHRKRMNAIQQVLNVPSIEYEFTTSDGSHVRGTRVTIGEDAAVNADAVVSRYPVGARVPVYYSPDRPAECVLERDAPVNMTKALVAVLLVVFVGVPVAGFGMVALHRALVVRLPHGHPLLAMLLAGGAIVVAGNGVRGRRLARAAADWPTTSGRVVASGVERTTGVVKYDTTQATYEPAVEYAFTVHGREFRSRRIDFGARVGTKKAEAERRAAAYPVGFQVQVQYDPQNPSEAVLHTATNTAMPFAFAAALFFAAVYFSGAVTG